MTSIMQSQNTSYLETEPEQKRRCGETGMHSEEMKKQRREVRNLIEKQTKDAKLKLALQKKINVNNNSRSLSPEEDMGNVYKNISVVKEANVSRYKSKEAKINTEGDQRFKTGSDWFKPRNSLKEDLEVNNWLQKQANTKHMRNSSYNSASNITEPFISKTQSLEKLASPSASAS